MFFRGGGGGGGGGQTVMASTRAIIVFDHERMAFKHNQEHSGVEYS